jgi:hypothetical protein
MRQTPVAGCRPSSDKAAAHRAETEPLGGTAKSRQMPRPHRIDPIFTAQGFDQLQAGIPGTNESRLELALLPLGIGQGISDDAAANPIFPR